ncbi:MAG: DUF433 domain-containing protein [Chloroflexia bacterium]|nr:DUF433 domain-containing protein [Chloroflexia bacterium]
MSTTADPIVALDSNRVSKLTGIPKNTLAHWEKRGVFKASYIDPHPKVPFRRIYSFRDVVSLRALALIRREAHVSFKEILGASEYLSKHYESPWSQLRFGLMSGKLVFWDPDRRRWSHSSGQDVLEFNVAGIPDEIRRSIPEVLQRDNASHGVITKNRYVQHNKPIIAGTRIPTSSIWAFHEAGYSPSQILREYPHLTVEDVDAALNYERAERHAA